MSTGHLAQIRCPTRWSFVRLDAIANRIQDIGEPELQPLSVFLDAGVVPRSERDDNHNVLGEDLSRYLVVAPGDIVFNKLRTWQGGLGISEHRGIVSPAYFVLRPCKAVYSRYLHHLLRSRYYLDELTRRSKWMPPSQFDIPWEQLRSVPVLLPPLPEQRAIADFLDHETARLDALVRAKERVLALLAEKRRALITRAVTRGLSADVAAKAGLAPRVSLRDSGIPWLGAIPTHWAIWKIGHLAIVGNGSTPNRDNSDYWAEGTVPWLNSSVVNQDEVTAADQFISETALRECHLPIVKAGSVLVGITGQGKTRGTAAVLSFAATINQHLAYITPRVAIADTWFLRWVLFAAYDFLRSISDDAGGTKGALTCEEVAGIRVPLPPVSEQHSIVGYITAEIAKLDAVRTATERTIALLKERRAALIAAAVTGKIDVEEAVA